MDHSVKSGSVTSASSEVTRRELMAITVVTGGALVGEQLMPGFIPEAAAQTGDAAPAPLDVLVRVNGTEHRLKVDPRTTLLDALREHLRLTGSKKGCGLGQCGACTVLIDGQRVNACLTLAVRLEGHPIVTIEGLARGGELHPLQQAFIDHDAFQCGYCTSGQIMSGVALMREGKAHTADEIRELMSGNLCRCGAYSNIVAAIRQAMGAGSGTPP